MRERTLSAVAIVPPLLVVLLLGGPWIVALVLLLVALAGRETFRLLRDAGWPAQPWLGIAIALSVVIDAAAPSALAGSGAILAAIGIVLAAIGAFTRPEPRDGLVTWVVTVFGAVYVGLLGFVVRLEMGAPDLPTSAPLVGLGSGRTWVLVLILTVWSYDTGAYLVGRAFGRDRFLAHISPSKTYAGLVGGLVATTVVLGAGFWAAGQSPVVGALLGPVVGLVAQAGDLAESMLKRAAGAKDSGNLIPGHGGVLDRVDSFLFAAPVMALAVLAVVR